MPMILPNGFEDSICLGLIIGWGLRSWVYPWLKTLKDSR